MGAARKSETKAKTMSNFHLCAECSRERGKPRRTTKACFFYLVCWLIGVCRLLKTCVVAVSWLEEVMLLAMSLIGIWGGGPHFTHSVYGKTSANKGIFRCNSHR